LQTFYLQSEYTYCKKVELYDTISPSASVERTRGNSSPLGEIKGFRVYLEVNPPID